MPAPTTPSEAIATKLLATAGVTALVSTRVYPSRPKQDPTWPYLVYFKVGGGDGARLDGFNKLQNYMMRVECYAETEAAAEAVMLAVFAAFNGWIDVPNKVKGCLPMGDSDQQVNDQGEIISGQSYSLWFLTA